MKSAASLTQGSITARICQPISWFMHVIWFGCKYCRQMNPFIMRVDPFVFCLCDKCFQCNNTRWKITHICYFPTKDSFVVYFTWTRILHPNNFCTRFYLYNILFFYISKQLHWRKGSFQKRLWDLKSESSCHMCIKHTSSNVWIKYFIWNFRGCLWNFTENILFIHWKIWLLYNVDISRALRFKS